MLNATPKSYTPPVKLSIPLPSPIPRARGIHSTGGFGGNIRVRCTDDEKLLVQSEANYLGLTLASFSRWCITHAAHLLKEHRDATTVVGPTRKGLYDT